MTTAVFRAASLPTTAVGETLSCGPEVAGHAVRVRKIGPGEVVDVIDGAGLRVTGTVTRATAENLELQVQAVEHSPEPRPALVLVQALAKGERDLQAVESATEIGVDTVIPWRSHRSIADWPEKKKEKSAQKWRHLLEASTLQSRRSRIPDLGELRRGTGVARGWTQDDLVLVLHETATRSLTEVLAHELPARDHAVQPAAGPECPYERIVLVVGPEGGITEEELAALQEAGAHPVLLGPTVLRSSSAGPAGLVLCQAALGRW